MPFIYLRFFHIFARRRRGFGILFRRFCLLHCIIELLSWQKEQRNQHNVQQWISANGPPFDGMDRGGRRWEKGEKWNLKKWLVNAEEMDKRFAQSIGHQFVKNYKKLAWANLPKKEDPKKRETNILCAQGSVSLNQNPIHIIQEYPIPFALFGRPSRQKGRECWPTSRFGQWKRMAEYFFLTSTVQTENWNELGMSQCQNIPSTTNYPFYFLAIQIPNRK